MPSLTLSVSEEFKNKLKSFLWINWSEIAREETMKKLILENYLRNGVLNDEDWKFCDKIDWHPVDELPIRKDFMEKLRARKKEKSIKIKGVSEIFK